jgi:hypothetical protein
MFALCSKPNSQLSYLVIHLFFFFDDFLVIHSSALESLINNIRFSVIKLAAFGSAFSELLCFAD